MADVIVSEDIVSEDGEYGRITLVRTTKDYFVVADGVRIAKRRRPTVSAAGPPRSL